MIKEGVDEWGETQHRRINMCKQESSDWSRTFPSSPTILKGFLKKRGFIIVRSNHSLRPVTPSKQINGSNERRRSAQWLEQHTSALLQQEVMSFSPINAQNYVHQSKAKSEILLLSIHLCLFKWSCFCGARSMWGLFTPLHSPPPPPTGVWCEQHQGDHTQIQQAKLEERWNIRTAACCNPPAPKLRGIFLIFDVSP